jgi:SAM-dependent methyltransferase
MASSADGSWRSPDWGTSGDAWATLASAHQYRWLIETLNRRVATPCRALDWGSGAGRTSYALLTAGHSVDALDLVEPPQVALLRSLGGSRFRFSMASDPVDLPYEDDAFDLVTSVGVLEHVPETGGSEAASLAEITRVLRPGGLFVCCHFPNKMSWIDALARRSATRHSHKYRYSRRDVRRLASAAQLRLVDLHRYGVLPRNSLGRLGGSVQDSPLGARVVDVVDDVAGVVLNPFCQNWAFVAENP